MGSHLREARLNFLGLLPLTPSLLQWTLLYMETPSEPFVWASPSPNKVDLQYLVPAPPLHSRPRPVTQLALLPHVHALPLHLATGSPIRLQGHRVVCLAARGDHDRKSDHWSQSRKSFACVESEEPPPPQVGKQSTQQWPYFRNEQAL